MRAACNSNKLVFTVVQPKRMEASSSTCPGTNMIFRPAASGSHTGSVKVSILYLVNLFATIKSHIRRARSNSSDEKRWVLSSRSKPDGCSGLK